MTKRKATTSLRQQETESLRSLVSKVLKESPAYAGCSEQDLFIHAHGANKHKGTSSYRKVMIRGSTKDDYVVRAFCLAALERIGKAA